ncbi:unnamed protein product [Acanthosepion pharaonis]|uniref:Uncharacterized protein n=1 Tax=Acanthosepion pharaonis TaxID=158019 RepID=A0A812E324_ACAPH|nr:unnamed protein product [Sepia pharaonis]
MPRETLDVRAALILHIFRPGPWRTAQLHHLRDRRMYWPVAHHATPSSPRQTDVLVYPLLWTLLARPRGEPDVRAALVLNISRPGRSAPRNSITSRQTDVLARSARATPSSLETDGCIGLSSPLDTASKARGERRPGSPSSPYIPSRPVAHRATPSSLETDGCIGLSSPLDTASKAEGETGRPGSTLVLHISRPGPLVAHCATPSSRDRRMYWFILSFGHGAGRPSSPSRRQLHPSSLETDGCIGLSSPLDTASKAERGTRRPGSPSSPYIPSRRVAHRATPSSSRDRRMLLQLHRLETDGCIGLSSPLNTSEELDVRAALVLHISRPPRNSIVSRDRRMYWPVAHRATPSSLETDGCIGLSSPLTLLARPRGEPDVRAALVLHISRPGSPVAHRATPSSPETDGCIGLSSPLDTPSKAERGTRRPGSPSSIYPVQARSAPRNSIRLSSLKGREGELDVRAALATTAPRPRGARSPSSSIYPSRLVARNSIISRDRRMYWFILSLDTASKAERGTKRPGSPSSPYILSRLVAHCATPSSLETDGSRPRGGTRRPGSPSSPYIPSRPVAHRATPSSLETDGCIGLSSPLDTASKAERGTRRPGSPSSPYIPSRLVAHRATPSSLETDGCIGLSLLWTLLARPRGELDVRAALVLHISRPGPAPHATPSSLETDGCTGLSPPLTLLARQGNPDVRAALELYVRAAPRSRDRRILLVPRGGTSRAALVLHNPSRSRPRNPAHPDATPLTLLARPRGELNVRAASSSPYIPSRAVAHRATPSSPETDGCQARGAPRNSIVSRDRRMLVYLSFDTAGKAERGKPDVRAALVLHISYGCNGYPLLWTLLARPRGEERPGSPSSPYIPSQARSALRNSIISRDRRMYWFILSLDTASLRPRGVTRRPGSPSSPYIRQALRSGHRATPSSPETDGCFDRATPRLSRQTDDWLSSPLDTGKAEGDVWAALVLHISCPGPQGRGEPDEAGISSRLVDATHRLSETDGCIGLSSLLDTASSKSGELSGPVHISCQGPVAALRNTIVTRDRRMLVAHRNSIVSRDRHGFRSPGQTGELNVRQPLNSRPGPAPRNPSSPRDRRMYWFILLWTLLARPRGELDVRSPSSPYILSRPVGTAQLHRLLETDGCIGLSSPLTLQQSREGELDVRAA